jgi:8-oxo-dGTP pyrophosphatase MutT (NUDIX family)
VTEASWVRDSGGDQTLEENWLFRLRRERFRSRTSGLEHDFYVLHLPDAVNVVALTPARRLVLVRQFRAGSESDSLETPGGLLEPGEDPLAAGARELLEETGYVGDTPIMLGTLWSMPSLMTSRVTTILIPNVRYVAAPRLDHAEEVRVELIPAESIPEFIALGRIDHALVVASLFRWLVAELPGPLAVRSILRLPHPMRIARLMVLIAAIALMLGLWVNAGVLGLIAIGFLGGCALFCASAFRLMNPVRRSTLMSAAAIQRRRRLVEFLQIWGR